MMDDIIDLELEKIDGILDKINRDPEDAETKRTERILWDNIREKTTGTPRQVLVLLPKAICWQH